MPRQVTSKTAPEPTYRPKLMPASNLLQEFVSLWLNGLPTIPKFLTATGKEWDLISNRMAINLYLPQLPVL